MIDPLSSFQETEEGLLVSHKQEIPQTFIDECSDWRKAQGRMSRTKEHHKVADIPVIFVHKWLQEGFNIYQEPLTAIVKKLKREGLDHFLTTEKRV